MVGFPARSVPREPAMPVLMLPPLPRTPVGEIPPSLLPGRGEPETNKRDVWGWLRTGAAGPPPPASPAGPNHLFSHSEALAVSQTGYLLAAASSVPVARLGLPKIIRHRSRAWFQLCNSHRSSRDSSIPFPCPPPWQELLHQQGLHTLKEDISLSL